MARAVQEEPESQQEKPKTNCCTERKESWSKTELTDQEPNNSASYLIFKRKQQWIYRLEIRSQNHHLAKTLLDLNMEMQRLRNENELSAASESKALNIAISPE